MLAGGAFTWAWMALVSGLSLRGKACAGVHAFDPFSRRFPPPLLAAGFGIRLGPLYWDWPAILLFLFWEVAFVPVLAVGLPASLFRRVTQRLPVLLLAIGGLWGALGLSLAGASVLPLLPYHAFSHPQGVFFCLVFVRYGLLASCTSVLTVESCLLIFPCLFILWHLDPAPYAIAIALWAFLLLGACAIYFRPQIATAYRRLAAVSE